MAKSPLKARIPALSPVDRPAVFSNTIAAGMKALSNGEANEVQQVAVFDWLLKQAAGIGTQSYRADPYAMAFAEGRRFVAIQMMMLLETKPDPQQKG